MSAASTVIATWIAYANIGKIDLGLRAGTGDHTWTRHRSINSTMKYIGTTRSQAAGETSRVLMALY